MAGGGLVAAAGKCLAAPESDKASHPTLLETARSWRGILVFTHLAREGRMTVTIDGGELLAALGGAVAAWPLAARGQQTATPVVGFVSGMSSSASERQAAAFLKGLVKKRVISKAKTWLWSTTGSTVSTISYQSLMADLVRRRVAVISTAGSHPAALAAKAATTTIPIVFSVANDPVQLGLVVSLARARKRTSAPCYIGHKQSSARLGLAPIQRRVIP